MNPDRKFRAYIWVYTSPELKPASVMGNQTSKRPWLQGTNADTKRCAARAHWSSALFAQDGVIITPFATGGFRVAKKPVNNVIGEAPQVDADLVDMGIAMAGRKVCIGFANADCLGIMVIAGGRDGCNPLNANSSKQPCELPFGRIVIGGHVGDAHIDKICDTLFSHLLQRDKKKKRFTLNLIRRNGILLMPPSSRVHEIYILRGRSLVKKWPDGKEENAADRLARLLSERYPEAKIFIAGKYMDDNPLAFPTSRVREATKVFLDKQAISPELGDNLLERLKNMPPALTPAYHIATNGVDFGDRHALVMEITI